MSNIAKLKKEYSTLQKKYKLPDFQILNERFDIEKLVEHETEMLVREIRRAIMEKAVNCFRFIEIFMNPNIAPMFFLVAIKKVNSNLRQPLEQLYTELGKLEIESLVLETSYNEKKEAEFIKKVNEKWPSISDALAKILEKIKETFESKEEKKEKSYFG